jgi:hypothetical protein
MAEIKKVVIEAGGKEFHLTVEEAKALRDILNSAFKEATTTYVPYPYPVVYEYIRRYYHPWVTWCDNGTVHCVTGNTLTSGNSTTL